MGPVVKVGAILGAIALIAAGCAPDAPHFDTAAAGTEDGLTVTMGEFAYSPSEISAVAGSTVTITLVNDGLVTHEFMLGRETTGEGGYVDDLLGVAIQSAVGTGFMNNAMAEEAPAEEGDHDEAPAEEGDHDEAPAEEGEAPGHGHEGNTIMVEPGGSVEVTLEIPADATGVWEMGCFIEGHYEAGMSGQLVVT